MNYPIERNLDGVFFRVERDGKWVNRCFTDLDSAEQNEVMREYNHAQTLRMLEHLCDAMITMAEKAFDENETATACRLLARVIRDMGDYLDIRRGVNEDD